LAAYRIAGAIQIVYRAYARRARRRANRLNLRRAVDDIDIVDLLPHVVVPTIVFHCIRDRLVPFDHGRRLAASIPNARFVPLDSENHALIADEPAWAKFVGEMEAFLSDGS
jgi:pimeloyl-ACP methyl ester carboxylesterase